MLDGELTNITWRERRRLRMKARKITALQACDEAAALVKSAGFVFVKVSMKSTTCYYRFPGRHGVLRISTHSKSKGNDRPETGPTFGSVTFPAGEARKDGLLHMSNEHIENQVARAIGLYMLKAGPTNGKGDAR